MSIPLIVAAHQPNFIPYLGFFDKMKKSNIFVIRDEVLFVKNEFQNRNLIRVNSYDNLYSPTSKWLTVPVDHPYDYIKYVTIKKDVTRHNKLWHLHMLHEIEASYANAPFFSTYFPEIKKIFDNTDDLLITLNMKIINFLKSVFKIKTEIILASTLNLKPLHYQKSDATEDLVSICQKLEAEVYLSGIGGKGYLEYNQFKHAKIAVQFQNFNHPYYQQNYPGFLPNMSAIDALFCLGKLPVII